MSLTFVFPYYLWLLLLVPIIIIIGLQRRRVESRLRYYGSLILRGAILISIIFALAGIQLRLRTDLLTTVFIMDVSDSIPPAEISSGEELIREAIKAMQPGDRAAVVLFGKDALVERLPSEESFLADLTSIPVTTRTDIEGAIQLASAILPNEGAKRLVLLSDGRENLGEAIMQAELAAANNIELSYVSLASPQEEVEVLIESFDSPAEVRQGEKFDIITNIHTTTALNAILRSYEDGTLIQARNLRLQPGSNRVIIPIEPREIPLEGSSGFRRFSIQVIPDNDTHLQNNQASAFTIVHGPPTILIVEGKPGDGENLSRALEAAEMRVNKIAPFEVPSNLSGLSGYEVIILVNVHAADLPNGLLETLPVYVSDLGKGLLMVGGDESFGAGGYLRTPLEAALPVDMDVKDKDLQANLALVLALDKSGSMGRCHCDDPDLNQSYTRAETGQPKVDIAKEAVMRAASALGDDDYLGVVAFDSQSRWALPIEKLANPLTIEGAIGRLQAEGQTNIASGVETAYQSLENIPARRKHIILMTDGWVRQGDLTSLAQEMKQEGITLSIVAAGRGSAEYLEALSELGGGRYYPARDLLNVPDIFLKETVKSVGEYIIEEPFYPLPSAPSAVLRGFDTLKLPPLLGYNGAALKDTARTDLLTPRGDPLLATWQYGLGRSAAWTSDFKNQWAKEWLAWEDFPRFSAQLVGWLLPAQKVEGLSGDITLEAGQTVIRLEAVDKNGHPRNFLEVRATIIGPDLRSFELPLKQIGPGVYQASSDVSTPGTYLVRIGVNDQDQSLGQITLGSVVPYSSEYRTVNVNPGFLSRLARITGGGELVSPKDAFTHNLPISENTREIWQPLLLIVALLFPLDVAVRRFSFGLGDFQRWVLWIQNHIPVFAKREGPPAEPQHLGQLFKARQRARQRRSFDSELPFGESIDESPEEKQEAEITSSNVPPEKPSLPPKDALARLRDAKKRARKG